MDQVQEIKERLNIVDVISGYLRLTKAGVNYKALCPFHNEKTPSFMVSPSRQSWHCFGCGIGGDIFTFVEKIEGLEFLDALKILAEKAGIILKNEDPKLRSEKDRIYQICEKAAQFFSQELNNPIINYLYKRGLKDETIGEWRLGYAPDSWDSLLIFLKKFGFKEPEIERAGLILKGEKYHDRFRNRLIFPIFDTNGRVVAFSGRIMNDIVPSKTERTDSGKYINSPETILFNKSRILYGLDKTKTEIKKADKAILVEGQMDVLLPWQDGVKNIVATSGTALTEDHVTILKRLANNLVLAFDMDEAGFRATKRGVDLAQSSGFNISVLGLIEGKDPADFVKERPKEFEKAVQSAEPIMVYYFNQVFKKFNPDTLEGKKFIAITLLSEIKKLPSAIERSNWIRELSLKLGVSESDLEEEMEQIELEPFDLAKPVNAPLGQIDAKTRKEILSEKLLALLLKTPESIKQAAKAASILPPKYFELLSSFSSNQGNFSDVRTALSPDLRPYLDFLFLMADYELEKGGPDFNIGEEVGFLIREIEKEHYKELKQKIGQEIKKQENTILLSGSGGALEENEKLTALSKELQNISEKLNILSENQSFKF